MSKVTVSGLLLNASEDERTLTYRLLPYAEPGHTSLGLVTASAGSVTLPEDASSVVLNLEHSRIDPLGRAVSLSEDSEGLVGTFRLLATQRASDALLEAREGVRSGISVELDNVKIRDGQLLSSSLVGAAMTVRPAFENAQLVASDFGIEPEIEEEPQEELVASIPTNQEETIMSETVVSTFGAASDPAVSPKHGAALIASAWAGNADAASAVFGKSDAELIAEWTVTSPNVSAAPDPYLGEVWQYGRSVQRPIISRLNQAPLPGFSVTGVQITGGFTVDVWAGGGVELPNTNSIGFVPVSANAVFMAGGTAIPREIVDLGSPISVDRLLALGADDYATKTETAVVTAILTASTTVTGGGSTLEEKIVKGVTTLLPNADVTTVVVSPADFSTLLLRKESDRLTNLPVTLSWTEGDVKGVQVVPNAALSTGEVLFFNRNAATVFELPGIIRVNALNVRNGLIEEALHGYYAILVNEPRAIIKVTA